MDLAVLGLLEALRLDVGDANALQPLAAGALHQRLPFGGGELAPAQFIDQQHRIINVAENAVPYSEQSIVSAAPGIAVLELNGGRTRELGIVAGNKVDW